MKQRLQTRLRLFHAETWLEASVHTDPPMAAIQQVRESRPNGGSKRQRQKKRSAEISIHFFKSPHRNTRDNPGVMVANKLAAGQAPVISGASMIPRRAS